jgi:hypothetical protein
LSWILLATGIDTSRRAGRSPPDDNVAYWKYVANGRYQKMGGKAAEGAKAAMKK